MVVVADIEINFTTLDYVSRRLLVASTLQPCQLHIHAKSDSVLRQLFYTFYLWNIWKSIEVI